MRQAGAFLAPLPAAPFPRALTSPARSVIARRAANPRGTGTMTMYSAITTAPGRAAAERLGDLIEKMDPAPFAVGVFEIEDGSDLHEIGVHFEDRPDAVALDLLAAVCGARPFALSEVPDVDWVAHVRRELTPVAAGRFFVYGAHDAGRVPEGRIALLIEAAMAFGTGHHATTLGCLLALDRLADGWVAPRVADIGCGTAVLGMAAARVWAGQLAQPVIVSDNDPVAVAVAEANVAANGLTGALMPVLAEGFDAPAIAAAAPFDLIFANILKGPLIALAPDMARHLAPGGRVILSGLLTSQADEILAHYARLGINPEQHDRIGDWSILTLTRDVEISSKTRR
jgi:ribosomal protein L11 methyltransferase